MASKESAKKITMKFGVIWYATTTLLNQGSLYIAAIVLGRTLGKEGFGEYSIVSSTVISLVAVAALSTGFTVTKFIAEYIANQPQKAVAIIQLCKKISFYAGFLSAAAFALGSAYIAKHLFGRPELQISILLGSLYILFGTVNNYQIGVLTGLRKFRKAALANATSAVIQLIITLFGAYFLGIVGSLIALSIGSACRWLIYQQAVKKALIEDDLVKIKPSNENMNKLVLSFMIPAALAGVISPIAVLLSQSILVKENSGLAEMAIYSAVNYLRLLVLFLPGVLNVVAVAFINEFKGVENPGNYRRVYLKNLRLTIAISILGGFVVMLIGKKLIGLFGQSFITDGLNLLILVILATAVIECIGIAIYQKVQSEGLMWRSLFSIALPRDVLLIALSWTLIPHLGALGLALSLLGSVFLALTMTILVVYQYERKKN